MRTAHAEKVPAFTLACPTCKTLQAPKSGGRIFLPQDLTQVNTYNGQTETKHYILCQNCTFTFKIPLPVILKVAEFLKRNP